MILQQISFSLRRTPHWCFNYNSWMRLVFFIQFNPGLRRSSLPGAIDIKPFQGKE